MVSGEGEEPVAVFGWDVPVEVLEQQAVGGWLGGGVAEVVAWDVYGDVAVGVAAGAVGVCWVEAVFFAVVVSVGEGCPGAFLLVGERLGGLADVGFYSGGVLGWSPPVVVEPVEFPDVVVEGV